MMTIITIIIITLITTTLTQNDYSQLCSADSSLLSQNGFPTLPSFFQRQRETQGKENLVKHKSPKLTCL